MPRMVKTTVYLPASLLLMLKTVARNHEVSEAEVIRRAIDEYTERNAPRPTLPLFDNVAPIEDWDEAMKGFGRD